MSKLLDDYEEEQRDVDDLELLEDIKMLGGITYTGESLVTHCDEHHLIV